MIQQLKNKDKEAFNSFIQDYQKKIVNMAYKYTNDYIEAQDLAQEVFIKVYKNIHTFDERSKLSTWLYKIAVNTCLDWKRKKANKLLDLFSSVDTSKEKSNIKSPEESMIYKEKQLAIHRAIYELKDKYKTVIILYHFNELSYAQISEILDLPIKTIETRLYRGRKKLKDKLLSEEIRGELYEF